MELICCRAKRSVRFYLQPICDKVSTPEGCSTSMYPEAWKWFLKNREEWNGCDWRVHGLSRNWLLTTDSPRCVWLSFRVSTNRREMVERESCAWWKERLPGKLVVRRLVLPVSPIPPWKEAEADCANGGQRKRPEKEIRTIYDRIQKVLTVLSPPFYFV